MQTVYCYLLQNSEFEHHQLLYSLDKQMIQAAM